MAKRRTALLVPYTKDQRLITLANVLSTELNFDLVGSSDTAAFLWQRSIECGNAAEIVDTPILGHRTVILSREICAALLATESVEDQAELDRLGIPRIDFVYVDLCPLAQLLGTAPTLERVLENTDIGGPALLRAAAKGRRVTICRLKDFPIAAEILRGTYEDRPDLKQKMLSGLAAIVEGEVARYSKCSGLLQTHFANIGAEYRGEVQRIFGSLGSRE